MQEKRWWNPESNESIKSREWVEKSGVAFSFAGTSWRPEIRSQTTETIAAVCDRRLCKEGRRPRRTPLRPPHLGASF
jgi:hypothetical protein